MHHILAICISTCNEFCVNLAQFSCNNNFTYNAMYVELLYARTYLRPLVLILDNLSLVCIVDCNIKFCAVMLIVSPPNLWENNSV